MAYSDFSLRKAKEDLDLTLVEGGRFLPELEAIVPSSALADFLQETIPLAIATGSKKARSELIVSPVLVEVRRQLSRQIRCGTVHCRDGRRSKIYQMCDRPLPTLYGSITSGTTWRFLKLEQQTVTTDLTEYPLPPAEQILAMLVWMAKAG